MRECEMSKQFVGVVVVAIFARFSYVTRRRYAKPSHAEPNGVASPPTRHTRSFMKCCFSLARPRRRHVSCKDITIMIAIYSYSYMVCIMSCNIHTTLVYNGVFRNALAIFERDHFSYCFCLFFCLFLSFICHLFFFCIASLSLSPLVVNILSWIVDLSHSFFGRRSDFSLLVEVNWRENGIHMAYIRVYVWSIEFVRRIFVL